MNSGFLVKDHQKIEVGGEASNAEDVGDLGLGGGLLCGVEIEPNLHLLIGHLDFRYRGLKNEFLSNHNVSRG